MRPLYQHMIPFQRILAQGFDQVFCCGEGGEVVAGGFLEMFAAEEYFVVVAFFDAGDDFGVELVACRA